MNSLKVKVRETGKVIYEGEVDRITSFNEVGQFDIYPLHANFISIIKKELKLFQKGKIIKEVKFNQAILKVKKDQVGIFLGIEQLVLNEEQITTELKSEKSK